MNNTGSSRFRSLTALRRRRKPEFIYAALVGLPPVAGRRGRDNVTWLLPSSTLRSYTPYSSVMLFLINALLFTLLMPGCLTLVAVDAGVGHTCGRGWRWVRTGRWRVQCW